MFKFKRILFLWLVMAVATLPVPLLLSCDDDNETLPSQPLQVGIPQDISAVPSETSLQLSWTAVENASGYELEANDGAGYEFDTLVTGTSYELEGLEPYTAYAIRLRAVVTDEAGNSSNSEWSAWQEFVTLDQLMADDFDGGDGTESAPYQIARPSQLALLARMVNEEVPGYFEDGIHYVLTQDIDLSRYDNWTPIGTGPEDGRYPYENPAKAFQGVFDGDGHAVTGLNVNLAGGNTFVSGGLFGVNDGSIRNLKVEGVVNVITTTSEKSSVCAGGIAGFNIIAYAEDGINTRPFSGGIESCSFNGSVNASCGSDLLGTAYAGGICGMAESGNIDGCMVTVAGDQEIVSVGGETSMSGGIAGAMNGGRITECRVEGAGLIETAFNAVPEGYYVYAQVGCVAGSVADASVENCTVVYEGTLSAPKGGEANVNMGVICGNSGSSVSNCHAEFSGEAGASAGGTISFGGITGSLSGYGECSVTASDAVLSGNVAIEQTDQYSDVHVGGIYGMASSAQVTACNASVSGSINVTSAVTDQTTNVNIGGICGLGGYITAGCAAVWDSHASVNVTSDRTNFGGVAGLVQASDNYAFLAGCYAINGAAVSVSPNTGTDFVANVGGVSGTFSGTYILWYDMSIPAYMTGCYALTDGSFSVAGDGVAKAVAGASEYATLSGVFWGSEGGTVSDDLEGSQPFSSLDQAGYEAAISVMNDAIANGMIPLNLSYTYNESLGYPTLNAGGM